MLKNKKVLLVITASIAAYKSAILVRLLVKAGADVKVVMTAAAKDFITPLTLSTLSKHPVLSDFSNPETGAWNNHVDLGLWADILVVAPASANTIGKMANGICDNLALGVYLSAKCPVFVAPAMDLDMYKHPSTLNNLKLLRAFGNFIIESNYGELASGLIGEGRMAEPEEILTYLEKHFSKALPLAGKTALVTAGPTYEAIDAVRFIGNYSSGKMGLAVAERLAELGAKVNLIMGPSSLQSNHALVKQVNVNSAEDMWKASVAVFKSCDVAVLAAAVADFKPSTTSTKKIKKSSGFHQIELTETIDILESLGKIKTKRQVLVGFALETDKEVENAKLKIKKKNLDFIVLNSLNDKGAGFKHDTNKITLIDNQNKIEKFELKSKQEVAIDIVNKISEVIRK